jgi:Tfp pilus assembly protein PilO
MNTLWSGRLIAFLFFIAILLLGYHYDLRILFHRFYPIVTETVQLQRQLNSLQQHQALTAQYQTQLASAQASFDKAIVAFPQVTDFAVFLQTFISQGEQQGIKFTTVHQLPAIEKDFYHAVPIELEIVGSFDDLSTFLQHCAQSSTLFSWGNWTITRQTPPATTLAENNPDSLMFMTTATFYYVP